METSMILFAIALITITISVTIAVFEAYRRILLRAEGIPHYNHDRSRAELDAYRDNLERKIYEIEEKLAADKETWREMYHILLSSQKDIEYQEKKTEPPKLSMFLRHLGLVKNDMRIDRRLVFVLTPFHESHTETFNTIARVCNRYGFKCYRGDEEFVEGDIFPHLLKNIVQARLIIANIDGRNPNVFYELGIAHAVDKPIILVSRSIQDVPFNLKSRSIILFEDQEDLVIKLKEALLKTLMRQEDLEDRTIEYLEDKISVNLEMDEITVMFTYDQNRKTKELVLQPGFVTGGHGKNNIERPTKDELKRLKQRAKKMLEENPRFSRYTIIQ